MKALLGPCPLEARLHSKTLNSIYVLIMSVKYPDTLKKWHREVSVKRFGSRAFVNCCKLDRGESKRALKLRLVEHKRAVQKSDVNNGIAMHVANANHSFDWVNARVVKTVPGYWERRTTEAILIKKSQKPMNLDNGLLLPSVWNPVLLNPPPPTHPPHDDVT